MRGFLVGSLALIVLYTLLQDHAANTVTTASNVGVAGFRRLLASDVAGVPNRAKTSGNAKPSSAPAGSGGTTTIPSTPAPAGTITV